IAGLVAAASWRYAFLASAAVAGVLAIVGLPASVSTRSMERAPLRTAYTLPVLRTGLAGFIGWGCLGGLAFLISFRAADVLGLDATGRGVLLTAFGVAGILTARPVGNLVDRWGGPASVAVGMLTGGALLAGVGVVPSAVVAGLLWALAGVSSQFVLVGVNSLALSGPGDRSGVVSVVQACRFLGASTTPVVFTPTYHADPLASFLIPVGLLFLGTPAALAGRRSERDAQQGVHGPP
ncbi:MAG TPA: MFS transporter, partial [Pseudonocardiaceae bacterium]|nr:MFS transporter [Pseudonocardiaceae bacterium]